MVTIDGVPQGRAPLTASVPVGRHRVEVASAGQTRAHDIDVADGRETVVQAAGADLKGMGSIRVTTDPAGAEVRIDGVLHGRAPLTVENVAEGTHTILVRDGSGSVRQTVRVREDETYDATIPLGPGWLAVFAPVKLEVLENGRPIGSTEGGRILTPPGPHTIEVVSQAMGFRETRQVEIKPGAVAAVTIAMPPATIEVVAPAESEILVDGRSVGTAPLGPLEVAVGTREIVMRHPTLGRASAGRVGHLQHPRPRRLRVAQEQSQAPRNLTVRSRRIMLLGHDTHFRCRARAVGYRAAAARSGRRPGPGCSLPNPAAE